MAETVTVLSRARVVCESCSMADTPWTRFRGLMGRRELIPGQGLLLRPSGSIHTCFMRFPIDVVFIDDATKKFIGSASTRQVLSILNDDGTSKRFMDELEHKSPTPFAGMGFLVTQFLAPCDTNATALQKFAETPSADALVIVSNDGPIGVVDRNRLVAKLMSTLAS